MNEKLFWEKETFVALDLETTGLDPKKSEIIEIGAVRFKEGVIDETFSCIIKPTGDIPNFIKLLTGISDKEIEQGILIKTALEKLKSFIGNNLIVCHNSSFDISFVQYHLSILDISMLTNELADTLELSRVYFPFLTNHKLATLVSSLNVDYYMEEVVKEYLHNNPQTEEKKPQHSDLESLLKGKKKHRALYDALATGVSFIRLTDFVLEYMPFVLNTRIRDIARYSKVNNFIQQHLDKVVNYQRLNALINDASYDKLFSSPLANALGFTKSHNVISNKKVSSETDMESILSTNEDKDIRLEKKPLNEIVGLEEKVEKSFDKTDDSIVTASFEDNGYINKKFPDYEYREGQVAMAKAVHKALFDEEYLIVEAGTGIGKTFAYLIPALHFTHIKEKKVFISTNTKNLQEQFFYKDLPFIKECLPIPFTAVIIKGRDNYLCLRKWNDLLNVKHSILSESEASALLYLTVWQYYTKTGDVSENSSFQKRSDSESDTVFPALWRKLVNDRFFCNKRYCSHQTNCYYYTIRQKAELSNIIVTNHYLIMSDLLNEKFNEEQDNCLIIDEAHNLPELASKCLGFTLTYSDFNHFFNQLFSIRNKLQAGILANLKADLHKSVIEDAKKTMFHSEIENLIDTIENNRIYFDTFFHNIAEIVNKEGSFGKLRVKEKLLDSFIKQLQELTNICIEIEKKLFNVSQVLVSSNKNQIAEYENHEDKINGSIERLKELTEMLKELSAPDWENHAYWISSFYTTDTMYPSGVINYAPLDVSQLLQTMLYKQMKSLIFTSATLALRDSFKYFSTRMGLDNIEQKSLREIVIPSPFDYNKQTKVIAPQYLPVPSDKYFEPQSLELLKRVITTSRAGCMVLFTSYKDLNSVYNELSLPLYEKNILLLAQGKGYSRNTLLEEFKQNGKAVLLGTSSFWEGIDVPGSSLSLLILYKLPFQVPTEPLIEAYYDKLKKEQKDPFMYATLPNAMLRFRQGFGRLIRNHTDKGAILILDSRIINKKYGSYFREIIPTNLENIETPLEIEDIIAWWLR